MPCSVTIFQILTYSGTLLYQVVRPDFRRPQTGNTAGFSLHAGVAVHERKKVRAGAAREAALGYKLERLCRYIARPAVIRKILTHLDQQLTSAASLLLPEGRAPPTTVLFV